MSAGAIISGTPGLSARDTRECIGGAPTESTATVAERCTRGMNKIVRMSNDLNELYVDLGGDAGELHPGKASDKKADSVFVSDVVEAIPRVVTECTSRIVSSVTKLQTMLYGRDELCLDAPSGLPEETPRPADPSCSETILFCYTDLDNAIALVKRLAHLVIDIPADSNGEEKLAAMVSVKLAPVLNRFPGRCANWSDEMNGYIKGMREALI